MICASGLIVMTSLGYVGQVVVKLQQRGYGAPGREPAMTEEQRRTLMAREFQRREELKVYKQSI